MDTIITKWVVDSTHSRILFKVKHLMITNLKGEFTDFRLEAQSEGTKFIADSIKLNIDASSVFTNNDDRDNHLRSPDFFDVDVFKEITFSGSSIKKIDDNDFELTGLLSIKGIVHEITLDVEFGGIIRDSWGNEKTGFSLRTKINRKDWGLSWNESLDAGGVLIGNEVRITAEIQFVNVS